MSIYELEESKIAQVREVFNAYDKDKDGYIEIDQLEMCLRACKLNPTEVDSEDILNDAGRGPVPFVTFLYIYAHASRYNKAIDELINAFRVLDRKHKGRLTVDTVRNVLKTTRQAYTEKQINDILDHSDVKDGFVNYESLAQVIIAD